MLLTWICTQPNTNCTRQMLTWPRIGHYNNNSSKAMKIWVQMAKMIKILAFHNNNNHHLNFTIAPHVAVPSHPHTTSQPISNVSIANTIHAQSNQHQQQPQHAQSQPPHPLPISPPPPPPAPQPPPPPPLSSTNASPHQIPHHSQSTFKIWTKPPSPERVPSSHSTNNPTPSPPSPPTSTLPKSDRCCIHQGRRRSQSIMDHHSVTHQPHHHHHVVNQAQNQRTPHQSKPQ